MHKIICGAAALFSAATLVATPSLAGPNAGSFSFSLRGGPEFSVNGDVHGGTMAPIADLGVLNPALSGVAATLDIGSRSWKDVYGTLYNFGGELGYGLSDNSEVFGIVSYNWGSGDRLQVGDAVVPALNTSLPVFGKFDKFKAWGIEAGYRQYFGSGGFRPYAAARLGMQFVQSIGATFTVPDAAITLANVKFYDSSTVFTLGADVGVEVMASDNFSLSLETGVRYATGLSDDDSSIGGLGLATINDEGKRLSIPVSARLTVSF